MDELSVVPESKDIETIPRFGAERAVAGRLRSVVAVVGLLAASALGSPRRRFQQLLQCGANQFTDTRILP